MAPMNYFLWGYIKIKEYVKNYENVSDLKPAIILTFHEVSDGMQTLTLTMDYFGRQLEIALRNKGAHI